ncbi:MAG: MFS transporter [Eubacteriales bacterium]|nr:MFS transporter [Eubacteriales bacterium]
MKEKKGFWSYENKMVLTLSLAFGFVMFDRFAIANLASFIMPDLGMNNTQLGLSMSVFAFSWAIIGLFGSYLADRKGSRKVLLASIVMLFSICSMLTGFASSFAMLIVIRLVMGACEGPVMPVSQSFIIPQSTPSRRGFNMGMMQVAAVGLVSTMLGPIIQVALAQSIGWRWTFAITIVPGIIIALMIAKLLVNPETGISTTESNKTESNKTESNKEEVGEKLNYLQILGHRNIVLSIIGTVFLLCWYICMLTFTPNYLITVKGLDPSNMSYVMSAFGVGAIVWGLVIPGLSDKFGRKPLVIIAAIMGVFASVGIIMAPASVPVLCVIAFFGWGGVGVCALMQSTIPAESGDKRYVSTIIGSNQLTGELIGATGGAVVIGRIADLYGLETALWCCGASMAVTVIVALFYKESAPAVLARKQKISA